MILGANPIFWSPTKQCIVARSSTKVEYHTMATAAAELQLVKLLLSELFSPMQLLPTLFSDNLCAINLSANYVFHSRMKHLAIDYHFIRDVVQLSELRVVYVSIGDQLADALTKPLSQSHLFSLCNNIDVIFVPPL